MDIRNSCSKKYLFKTRKRAKVDVERVAHGHIVNQLQKQRKKKKKKGGVLQHCFSHTQPISVVFKVCTYRNKSQL